MNKHNQLSHIHTKQEQISLSPNDAISSILELKNNHDKIILTDPYRYFSDCYELDDYKKPTKIIVNLNKAKKVWLDVIRAVRNNRLGELDNLTLRALGRGNQQEVARIEGIKQLLRDLPEKIISQLEQAQSVEDIMNIRPQELLFE